MARLTKGGGRLARDATSATVCHHCGDSSTVSRATRKERHVFAAGALLSLLWLGGLAVACGGTPSDFRLAPVGHHAVHVGETWTHSLTVLGEPSAPLTWTLVTGPAGLALLETSAGPQLVWVPDALRLGPSPAGKPRIPGPVLQVRVQATDADGISRTADGTLQVVPTPLPHGIDAPKWAHLALANGRTLRVEVRTDTTDLAGMPVVLDPAFVGLAELMPVAVGRYVLRFRPDDTVIRDSTRVVVRLASPDWQAPVAVHELEVEWTGAREAAPCLLDSPVLRVDLPAQVTSVTALSASVMVLDGNGPPAFVQVRTAVPESGAEHMETLVPTLDPQNGSRGAVVRTLSVPGVSEGFGPGLVSVGWLARDLDDPLLGVCGGSALWPVQGDALVGVGPGCTDDAIPATKASPLELLPNLRIVRRECPQQADVARLQVPAGRAVWVRSESPEGWPRVEFEVRDDHGTLCQGHSQGRPCGVSPSPVDRALDVVSTATAPTSASLLAVLGDDGCDPAAEASAVTLTESWTEGRLCAGESRRLLLPTSSGGDATVEVTADAGPLELLAVGGDGRPTQVWSDRGGGLIADVGKGSWNLSELRLVQTGDRPASFLIRVASEEPTVLQGDPFARSTDAWLWLPGALDVIADLSHARRIVWSAEREAAVAWTLVVGAVQGMLTTWNGNLPEDVVPATAMPALAAEVTLSTAEVWQVIAASGPGLLIAQWTPKQDSHGFGRFGVSLPDADVACEPDRLDRVGDSATAPVLLSAPGPRPLVVAELTLCGVDQDWIAFPVAADALVEVATLSRAEAAPPIEVTPPDGTLCVSTEENTPASPPGLRPASRQLATCWVRQAGLVHVRIGPGAWRYDLVVRAR